MIKDKKMTIRVEEDFHKQIKIRATLLGVTITDYLLNLVKEDLEKAKKEEEK